MKPEIAFEDFSKLDIRIGTIINVLDFPNAKKSAYQLSIDFGELGIKKSSAQITDLYTKKNY
jgi:tRNA-binding protein